MASGTGRDDLVLAGVEDGVAGILLNRPDTRNAWTPDLEAAYHAALDDAESNDDVRVIVVTGAGESFCTTELRPGGLAGPDRTTPLHPLSIAKPVIAAINGECSGMGFAMALLCDVRFAASSATMTVPYARRGQPLPGPLAWLLPRTLGLGGALDVVLSGRELDAREALRLGIVQGVYNDTEVTERVLAYAGHIVERGHAKAIASIKAQVYRATEMGLAQAIDDARVLAERLRV